MVVDDSVYNTVRRPSFSVAAAVAVAAVVVTQKHQVPIGFFLAQCVCVFFFPALCTRNAFQMTPSHLIY